MKINIGGGGDFRADGWLNLDGQAQNGFVFTDDCTLPAADASVELVYSSHTFEHLDDVTISRVLDESRRVLKSSGAILIKVPDFDKILDAYRRGNDQFFFSSDWGFQAITPTFGNRTMGDTIEARVAFLFCGFWNKEFGHLFATHDANSEGAYCGCPVMPQAEIRSLLLNASSPHAIAAELRARVVADEMDYTFNHQNAWSRDEMEFLLESYNFNVIDFDADRIIAKYKNIPGITAIREISMYCESDVF